MENITTLTTKGQVTIPKAIRDRLGLKPFDKLRFFIDEEGEVRMRKAYPSLEDVVASLPALASDLSIEEAIELAKEERASEWAAKLRDS